MVGPVPEAELHFPHFRFALLTTYSKRICVHNAMRSFMSVALLLLLCRLALSKTRRFDTLHDHEFNL
jgi:hypothetical protein